MLERYFKTLILLSVRSQAILIVHIHVRARIRRALIDTTTHPCRGALATVGMRIGENINVNVTVRLGTSGLRLKFPSTSPISIPTIMSNSSVVAPLLRLGTWSGSNPTFSSKQSTSSYCTIITTYYNAHRQLPSSLTSEFKPTTTESPTWVTFVVNGPRGLRVGLDHQGGGTNLEAHRHRPSRSRSLLIEQRRPPPYHYWSRNSSYSSFVVFEGSDNGSW